MKILYGVTGEGLGHTMRARALAEELTARGHTVCIAASSRAASILKNHGYATIPIDGFRLEYRRGAVERARTLASLAYSAPHAIRRNVEAALVDARTFRPDAVITDFDSFSYLVGWLLDISSFPSIISTSSIAAGIRAMCSIACRPTSAPLAPSFGQRRPAARTSSSARSSSRPCARARAPRRRWSDRSCGAKFSKRGVSAPTTSSFIKRATAIRDCCLPWSPTTARDSASTAPVPRSAWATSSSATSTKLGSSPTWPRRAASLPMADSRPLQRRFISANPSSPFRFDIKASRSSTRRGSRPSATACARDVATFEEFWPHYLRLHARRETRIAHAIGTTSAIALGLAALAFRQPLLLLAAPLTDYAISQLSHRLFERNVTTPWAHPLWHARAELRMFRLVCSGRMP